MKKFTYKNYKNCSFSLNHYTENPNAMAISITKDDELIAVCTCYLDYITYTENFITIKNYSENSYMTNLFKDLGIILCIIDRIPCNQFVKDSIYTDNPQTIDLCIIDLEKLKEYCNK